MVALRMVETLMIVGIFANQFTSMPPQPSNDVFARSMMPNAAQ